MARGDKNKYTDKQKRKADHIAEGYEQSGVSETEAKSRAWATVNKQDGGGKQPGGSGRKRKARAAGSGKGTRTAGRPKKASRDSR
jgi:plasmid stabilization system protein ParE